VPLSQSGLLEGGKNLSLLPGPEPPLFGCPTGSLVIIPVTVLDRVSCII